MNKNPQQLGKSIAEGYQKLRANNLFYKLLAVLLSILLWAFASSERQINSHDRVLDSVPVQAVGLPGGLILTEGPGTIQVTLRGEVESVTASDINAVVDLSSAQAGEVTLPVQVYTSGGVSVVSVKPSRLKLKLDNWVEKQVPVEVSISGQVKAGKIALTPAVKPSQVILRGGESQLSYVQKAYVSVDLKEAEGSISETLPVRVYDRSGGVNQSVQVYPASVEVTVPVVSDQPGRMVAVQPNITGSPARGYLLGPVRSEPATVQVFAPPEVLSGISHLSTEPISIEGAKMNAAFSARVVLPPGVEAVEPTRVNVQVGVVEEAKDARTIGAAIQVENLGPGLRAELQPTEVEVKVTGPPELLGTLTAADLKASVNLSELEASDYRLTVNVTAPEGISVLQVTPSEAAVSIKTG